MLCDDCRKNEATVFLKAAVNNKLVEMHLCGSCAAKKGLELGAGAGMFSLSGLFENLSELTKEFLPIERRSLRCSACGFRYSDFKETGRLGCPHCYVSFESQLIQLLTRIHGSTKHTGKKYMRGAEATRTAGPKTGSSRHQGDVHAQTRRVPSAEIESLKIKLKKAVEREDYETAARLRDRIKEYEGKSGSSPKRP